MQIKSALKCLIQFNQDKSTSFQLRLFMFFSVIWDSLRVLHQNKNVSKSSGEESKNKSSENYRFLLRNCFCVTGSLLTHFYQNLTFDKTVIQTAEPQTGFKV